VGFSVNVTQEEVDNSNISLDCPADIVVTAPVGDNAVTVNWSEPSASTTCTGGGSTGGDCSATFKSGFSYMGTFENSQFYLSNNNASWQEAKMAAEQAGGRLAIINNTGENDFIQQHVNNEIVFIGLSDDGQEGSLRWVDGSSVSYSKFVSDVNNSGDNDYVTLYPWNGEWDLNGSFVSKKYVLEIPCSNGGGGGGNGLTVSQTSGGSNGSNFSVGTTSVTYTATDDCGNTATCSFNVTVNASPAILSMDCPSDLSIQIPAGQSSTAVSWAQPTAAANCNGGARVTQIEGNGNGNQFLPGNYTITYSATDNCGNEETCSFSINVTSTPTNLSINCLGDRDFEIPAGQTQTQINWAEPTATTNCPNGATVNQISGMRNFSQVGVGTYNISYEATDNCGNQEVCSFDITVTQAPTNLSISCPSNQTVEIPAGQTTVVLNWVDPIASTNCSGNAAINQIGGTSKFSVVGAGTYTISYEGSDDCGNRETCSFNITVNQPQVSTSVSIDCPSNLNLQLPQGQSEMALNWTDPTAISNCSEGATINQIGGPSKFSSLGLGTYVISYEATDNCGNQAICDFMVTIEIGAIGGSNISLNCPGNITVEIAANESSTNVNWTAPTASTTCPTDGGGEGDCSNNNISGYSYMGEFQGSQYYKSNANFNFALAREQANNEGGNIVKITSAEENEFIRQHLGSDLCIIGVNDEASEGVWKWADGSDASYLNFPASINNNFSADYGVMNFWNGQWELTTDFIYKKYILEIPCGVGSEGPSPVNVNQIAGPASGSNFGVGTTTISYQATDDCGNAETCAFTVTVNQAASVDTNDGPPTAVVSTASTTVSDDFMVNIVFSEPVTGLNEYDLVISNANPYNFTASSGTNFIVMINPIDAGNVSIQVPTNVAFDSDIQGNLESNTINVNYAPDNGNSPEPTTIAGSCVVTPTAVLIEDGGTVGGMVNHLIDGSSLSGGEGLEAEHGGGSLYDGVWLNDGIDATIRFDLGEVQSIDGVAIWNYSYHTWRVLKRRGVRDFQISTSTDGVNYSPTTFFTAEQTSERGINEEAQVFNFPSVTARYVRLRILNALDDGFYVGLGEVRFINNCGNITSRANEMTTDIGEIAPTLTTSRPRMDATVYPNPSSGNFYLDINAAANATAVLQVMNEVGAIIYQQKLAVIENGPLALNLMDQADGMYFVRILIDNEFPILKKVIKTNR